MESLAEKESEEAVNKVQAFRRVWVLPILRCLEEMGGFAKPRKVRDRVYELFSSDLTPEQLTHLEKTQTLGWVRLAMVHQGLLKSEPGTWEIAPLGQQYLDDHKDDALKVPATPKAWLKRELNQNNAVVEAHGESIEAESKKIEASAEAVKTVLATPYQAFYVPVLRYLKSGRLAKKDICLRVEKSLDGQLLPGDFRIMPKGARVLDYRIAWALSYLKREGEVNNPARAVWEITEKGRKRLAEEKNSYDIKAYQGSSKVTVLLDGATLAIEPFDPRKAGNRAACEDDQHHKLFDLRQVRNELEQCLGEDLSKTLLSRLRLDNLARVDAPGKVNRNLIFYGPPGTGKTHLAKAIAVALTGDKEPGDDSHWQIVQFHPSYAYEDFVCGLRPNLEKSELVYVRAQGPFLDICERAADEPDRYFILVIDEINRGDPARIFGELMYALEYRDEEIKLSGDVRLVVPSNLIVIGTMNSVDRSVGLVDYALRRRFSFIRMDPDSAVLRNLGIENADLAAIVLDEFNHWLEQELDKDHTLGHSIFLNPSYHSFDQASFSGMWNFEVGPLMEEYFFDDEERFKEALGQWKKSVASAFRQQDEVTADENA